MFKEPTPPKINMEPDKCSRKEKETHLQTTLFFGFHAIFFRGVLLCIFAEGDWQTKKQDLLLGMIFAGDLSHGRK